MAQQFGKPLGASSLSDLSLSAGSSMVGRAPSPGPGAAPSSGGMFTAEAPGPAGALPQLWVPVALLAHAFAIAFLVKFVLLLHPGTPRRAVQRLQLLLGRLKAARRSVCARLWQNGRVAAEQEQQDAAGAAADAALDMGEAAKELQPLPTGADAAASLGLDPSAASLATSTSLQSSPSGTVSEISASLTEASSSELEGGGAGEVDAAAKGFKEAVPMLRRLSTHVSQLQLEWRNLGCSYKSSGGTKVVLEGVYGAAHPGEMQALLGPSGAGKSTLMDILAQRKSVGSIKGRLMVNGQPMSKAFIRKTAYVPQVDNFVPTMTTEETLAFFASLVLPASMSSRAKAARVQDVLAALGLSHTCHTLVGGQLPGGLLLRGLSGGERKRLSIAAGIIATPSVVFLDEPTSGLDSFAALTVMGHLKRMAGVARQVVLASIHQPRAAIWSMFDSVLVLSAGRMMYQGPVAEVVPWFSGCLGYRYDPQLHGVTSDWVMDLVSVAFAKPKQYYGHTMRSTEELEAAADKFRAHFLACHGLPDAEDEEQGDVPEAGLAQQQLQLQLLSGARSASWENSAGDVETGATPAAAAGLAAASSGTVLGMPVPVGSSVPLQQLSLPTSRTSTANSGISFANMSLAETSTSPAGSRAATLTGQPLGEGSEAAVVPAAVVSAAAAAAAAAARPSSRQAVSRRVTFMLPQRSGSSDSLGPLRRSSSVDVDLAAEAASMAAAVAGSSSSSAAPVAQAAYASASAPGATAGGQLSRAMLSSFLEVKRKPTPFHGNGAIQQLSGSGQVLSRQGSSASATAAASPPQSIVNIDKMMAGLRAAEKKSEQQQRRQARRYATSWGRQYLTLLWRETISITRNPADVAGRMLTFVWVSLLVGFIYYDLAPDADSIGLRLNLLFSNICFFMLMPYISMSLFAADKQFYVADISARIYRPSAYYAAKATAHLPFSVLSSVVFCLVTYGMAGFRASSGIMARYTLLNVLLSLIANQVLHLAATLTPNQDMAFMLAILWTAVNLLMSNYFVTYTQIAYGWFSQLRYLSAVGFTFDGVTQEEFSGVAYDCSAGLGNGTIASLQRLLPNTAVVQSRLFAEELARPSAGCVINANAVLDYYEAFRPFAENAAILVAYLVLMHLLSFLALLAVARKERR